VNIESYFNDEIKPKLIDELSKANKEIVAAVAWFNDKDIYETLIAKAKEGIIVDLIISNDPNNFNSPDSLDFEELINVGAKVNRLITDEKLMHHKFCVIDNHTIITGSYNWTYGGSNSNLENIVLIENDIKNCEKFKAEYERMLKTYFKHLDEAVEILEKMKTAISDLQGEIIKHRYLPDKIIENLKRYGSGNFLLESPSSSSDKIQVIKSSEINKTDWWENIGRNLKIVLNDIILKVGKVDTKPADDAIEYLIGINEINISGYNRNKWDNNANGKRIHYDFAGCDGLNMFPKLTILNISNNYLSDDRIKAIGQLSVLEKLNISNNKIKTLPLTDYLPKLVELDISHNQFNSIDFISNLPNLRVLKCNGNQLSGLKGIEKGKNIRFLFLNRDTFELPFIKSQLTELGFVERDNETESIVKLENEKTL